MVDTELETGPSRDSDPQRGGGRERENRRRGFRGLPRAARLSLTVTAAAGLVALGVLWTRGAFWAPVHVEQVIDAEFTLAGHPPALPWPAEGEAYLYVEGVGSLGSSGPANTAVPIASVTKTMTAYQVLKDHPLGPTQDGPVIAIDQRLFNAAQSRDGGESGIEIRVGERLTERQALEGMLLPSAGNVARLLATWDAGSVAAFVNRMNAEARALGMNHTNYADPAGIDPNSRSTAFDQVELGERVLENPTFADIVDMKAARIPVAGVVTNTDRLLGVDGDIGIKTGSTTAAGGCLLFATRTVVGGLPVTMVGAVLGQPGEPWTILDHATTAARTLIEAAQRSLVAVTVAPSGRAVAELRQRGHSDIALAPGNDVTVVGWPSLAYRLGVTDDKVLRVSSKLQPDAVAASAALAQR